MANVMLNHREHHCYYNPVGMQDINDEDDEATSHAIERVPSRTNAAAVREIVDVDTFVVGGLVIEKVRTDVSFYYVGCVYCKMRMIVDDHGNLRCERHACVNGNIYFLATVGHGLFYVVDLIRPVFGRSVRRRCKRPFSYARNHSDVQAEHFGRDTRVSHH